MRLDDYVSLVHREMLPFQYLALHDKLPDAEKSYAVENLKVAAGLSNEAFRGTMWQDSDVAKWLEAVGHSLKKTWDEALFQCAEEMVDLVAAAQMDNGYLQTYFTVEEPDEKWHALEQGHELYCMGHFIEAGVAYYEGTGREKLLEVARRMADEIDRVFGLEEGKLRGHPGHEEIELALMKLYRATGEKRYLDRAKYFIDVRGGEPNFFQWQRAQPYFKNRWPIGLMHMEYMQNHMPIRQMEKAVGHAVCAMYYFSGAADVAKETSDASLAAALTRLWNDVVNRQMYVTGAVGSSADAESFTEPYHLPNDRAYAETCAAVGLVFFARRMLELDAGNAEYADVMERVIYNGVLSSFGLDAKRFFYVNPQQARREVCGRPLGEGDPILRHVATERRAWYGCACCPPNAARLLSSLTDYAFQFVEEENALYIHLFYPGEHTLKVNGGELSLRVETEYPWDGMVRVHILSAKVIEPFGICIRIPEFARGEDVSVSASGTVRRMGGYVRILGDWTAGGEIALEIPIRTRLVRADLRVQDNAGCAALMRGPLVYCLESCDNPFQLSAMYIDGQNIDSIEAKREDILGGAVTLTGDALLLRQQDLDGKLYTDQPPKLKPVRFKAIPYHLWANRGEGDMQIWLKERI